MTLTAFEAPLVKDALLNAHRINVGAVDSMWKMSKADREANARVLALCELRVSVMAKVLARLGVKPT